LSEDLRQLFGEYEWPGNIRELENMIKRLVILQDEQLVVQEIDRQRQRQHAAAIPGPVEAAAPAAMAAPPAPPTAVPTPANGSSVHVPAAAEPVVDGPISLADVARAAATQAERIAIERTLKQVLWNRRKAARILGVSYKTLLNKIKDCGISRP
jgi:DNA-binding NtrC family response regulator